MHFKRLIERLLQEGKIEDLQVKFPTLDVQDVAMHDPSPTKKYLEWMCKQLLSGASTRDLYPTIKSFDKNFQRIQNKDINSYQTSKQLEDVIKSLPEKSKKQQREEVKGNAPKIYENEMIVVVRPDDKNSCIAYGANTKWCITMRDESYYEQYVNENVVFYFVISKYLPPENKDAKIAIAVMRDDNNKISGIEMYDARDNLLNAEEDDYNVVSERVLSICKKDAVKMPKAERARVRSEKLSDKEYEDAVKSGQEEYAIHGKESLLYDITKNPFLSAKLLDKLSVNTSRNVKANVARHKNTSAITLAKMGRTKDWHIRHHVALNDNTSVKTLDLLSYDEENSGVVANVASNLNTSPKTLERLADVSDEYVKNNVASNQHTPPYVLDKLSREPNYKIQINVAKNENTSLETLKRLLGDNTNVETVKLAAKKALKSRKANEMLVRNFVNLIVN